MVCTPLYISKLLVNVKTSCSSKFAVEKASDPAKKRPSPSLISRVGNGSPLISLSSLTLVYPNIRLLERLSLKLELHSKDAVFAVSYTHLTLPTTPYV